MAIQLKNKRNIEKIKSCGSIISEVHSILSKLVEPGVSTWELDKVAEDHTIKRGFKPAFKGYQDFPGSICSSINNEVVHGIPSKNRILNKGDIIGIDFGVYGAPETFLVNSDGLIIHKHVGPIDESYYNKIILPLIEK